MPTCKIILNNKEGEVVAGTITLDNDKNLMLHTSAKYDDLMREIMSEKVFTPDESKKISSQDDPVVWFNQLPRFYHGTYLYAVINP